MRICVLSRGFPDEESPLNGIYEWGQAKLLSECGYGVVFLAVDLRSARRKRKRGVSYIKKDGIDVFLYNFPIGAVSRKNGAKLRFCAAKKMLSAMEEQGLMPDLVWACFGRSLGRTAKKIYDVYSIPYIVSEFEARLLTEKIKKSEMRDLTKVYGNAAARIARNEPFARALERRTGYNFSVVPQAVCIEETKRASHSDFRFVSVGALSVDKGMDVVLRAFSRIKKIRRDTTLTIVGSGDEYNNLVRQTQALGITDSVIFVRPSGGASIKNILKDCDCFVLASRKELFGVVYLIAMSVGLPCVTTDCFAPRQIIPPYCGVVCDVDDTRGIEEGMLAVMRNPSRYSEERIKKYMIEKFSTEAVSDKIRGILSKIFI